jgi:hypothetical protein
MLVVFFVYAGISWFLVVAKDSKIGIGSKIGLHRFYQKLRKSIKLVKIGSNSNSTNTGKSGKLVGTDW